MAGIAILGAGIFATEEHLPALVLNKANIKAVYSRSKSTASTLVAEASKLGVANLELYSEDTSGHTLDDLLKRSDIEAVVIVLPILVQPSIVRRCLAAGKHVLCEKPIAKDVATARELIDDYKKLYSSKGLIFNIAEQFRFMHEFELGRKWIVEEKAVGDITQAHLKIWRNQPPEGKWYETPWRKVPEYQGGQEVVETAGFARQVLPHLPPLDTLNAGILLSGGGTGTISMSFASTRRASELTIIGSKGSFFLTDGPDGFILSLDLATGESRSETIRSKGVELEIKAFLEAVKAGKSEKKAGPEEALNDLAIIESMCNGGGKVELY
ncbi:oxidoreductase family, NAD-binding rossmann fold domain-containing protein [Trichoderma breve]|uniref:Oxidoreductase family, NAD-binding rossmann fold domain-containing protein n=1 Tax=Trichoderma breve TaxID=2034170 RepID=A0A9W9B7E0_9HYPO|nr:oxidoreductase family, NAD-binding rossmann fold domain-containing protein [Trichoderma breve]KAJ4854686.1 oxidoreductase family, NAD-binding rossmann fold domain-containing protein [Trichoderma breve]